MLRFLAVLSLINLALVAKTYSQVPTITGTSSIMVGSSYTYNVTWTLNGSSTTAPVGGTYTWTVYGGTVHSSGSSYAAITWSGSGYILYEYETISNYYYATLNITVSPCPPTPSVTFSIASSTCPPRALSYTGTPVSGTTWYWQTSASGTSTTNSTNAYNVTATGTYYVRAYNASGACWSSGAASYTVSTVSTAPAAPTIPTASTNTCYAKTLSKNGSQPSGITWYWHGTNPLSQDNTSATATAATYSATLHGTNTYYIRARNNSSGCWSLSPTGVSVNVNNPPAPNTNSAQYCEWETLSLTTTGYSSGLKWYDTNNTLLYTGVTYTPVELNAGNYTYRAKNINGSCESTAYADVTLEVKTSCDEQINWAENIDYGINADGTPLEIAASKVYSDGSGNTIQSQSKTYTGSTRVWASQSINDFDGRPALTTLAAPINSSSFGYRHRFVTTDSDPSANVNNIRYTASSFDNATGSGSVDAPNAVSSNGSGSLGWYYSSSNNLEPNTPVTSYPYIRSRIEAGPNPVLSRRGGAGDAYRMGSGHETSSEKSKILVGELDHYFRLRPHFVSTPTTFNVNMLGSVSTSNASHFAANLSVSVTPGATVMTVTCGQNGATPGVLIGGVINVTAGKTYTYKLKGYKTTADPAGLYVASTSGTQIVWPGATMPTGGASSEGWISATFTVPAGITQIRVGALWNPGKLSDVLYITGVDLRSELPSTAIGYRYVDMDADGKKICTFVDLDGRELASALITSTTGTDPAVYTYDYWSYTYYNDLNQVVATIAPNGVNTGSNAYPSFVTTYVYDHLGRLIETSSPDEGITRYVYSDDGKIRFSQSDVQRTKSPATFSYTNYDNQDRVIESGEYTMSGSGYYVFEREDGSPLANSVLGIVNNTGFTGISKKVDAVRCADFTIIVYDVTESKFKTDANHSQQRNLRDQVSATLNPWDTTWYSYDERGQLEWTKQSIAGLGFKTVDYSYDYIGNITDVIYQKGQSDDFYHHYLYDADQRLSEVKTSLDGVEGNKVSRSKYYYYLHGPLKRIELLGGTPASPLKLQGIDYVYTIDGGLKTINNGDPTKDTGQDGIGGVNAAFMKDVFGETLHYYDNDYTGATYGAGSVTLSTGTYPNQYGGNLRAAAYNNATELATGGASNKMRLYGYQYDTRNQLTNAQLSWVVGSTPTFSDTLRENITGFDKNGNIQALQRKGKQAQVTANYGYVYEANTNRLDKVNHNSALLTDYTYNTSGQLTEQSEGSKVFRMSYNAYGQVLEVKNGSNQLLMSYQYDDRGDLVKRVTYNAGTVTRYTYYVHDAMGNVLSTYEQVLPGSLQLIEVPLYGAGRFGIYKPVADTYFYEVNDHLGNVRAVIGQVETESYTATMESEISEEPPFTNVNATRVNFLSANHTPNSSGVTGNQVSKVNNVSPAGPAIILEVSPGDVVNMNMWAYYEGGSSNFSTPISEATMLQAIATAFGGVSGDPGELGRIYNNVQQGFPGTIGSSGSSTVPAAFLTCIVYDRNFVRQFWTSKDVTSAANMAKENVVASPIKIEHPGYVYICAYNRSDQVNPVYFDDLNVTVTHSPVVAGADYYPFGLVMDGKEIKDEAYRYGYQGQFSEKDLTTGMQEFELRTYDPKIGRWTTPDPYGQFASGYVAMGNTPNMSVDPAGGWSWITAGVGFAAGATVGYIASDGDWGRALAGGVVGGLIGGISFNQDHLGATKFNGGYREYGGLRITFNSKLYSEVGNLFKNNWTTVANVALMHVGQGSDSPGVTNTENCTYACEESFEQYVGGRRTRRDFNRNQNGTVTDKGPQSVRDWANRWIADFRNNVNGSGTSAPSAKDVISNMKRGKVYAASIKESGYPPNYEHNVLIRKVQKNKRTRKYRYNLMDPNGDRTMRQVDFNSVHKRHLILKR